MRQFLLVLSGLSIFMIGCRSGHIVRLHDRPRHEYRPAVAEDVVVTSDVVPVNVVEDLKTPPTSPSTSVIQRVSAESVSNTLGQTLPLPSTQGAGSSDARIAGGPGLEQCISLALAQNPDLMTIRQTEYVRLGALGVAQTYPFNPYLQVQGTPYQQPQNGGPGTMYHYVLLMQTIQLAHQQTYREQSAAGALNSTRWNIHQAELLTVATTERLYFNAWYLHGVMQLAKAADQNNRQLLQILENQLEAGQATAADVAIVRVDEASTRQQLQLASANYQSAVRDLGRHLGVSADQMQQSAGNLESITWLIPVSDDDQSVHAGEFDFQSQDSIARAHVTSRAVLRPDVMAARADIDVARANLCLASASKTPDLQIGPYYQTAADSTVFIGFRGQIDLPVINNGEPLERQRSAEHRQRYTAWQQAQRRAELEAEAAFDRYTVALKAAESTSDLKGVDLSEALAGLEKLFLEGEVDIVRVVQARTSLLQNQRARLDLLNEVAQSAAALTGTTGIPIAAVLQIPE
jgi:cobalt-zinc-cadmium efflux system outer membrane protein